MYRVSKNLSNELQAIPSKTQKVGFTIDYISKLVDKRNIKALEEGELEELMIIIQSTIELANKKQQVECAAIYDALVAEEAKRLDRTLNKSLLGRFKKRILKFVARAK